jgi:hypothetical protein
MERKWFKMIEGVLTEAPQQIETANGALYNYNCDSNEVMLRAGGYLPEDEIDEIDRLYLVINP